MLKDNYILVNIISPYYFTELTRNVFCDWKMNIVYVTISAMMV